MANYSANKAEYGCDNNEGAPRLTTTSWSSARTSSVANSSSVANTSTTGPESSSCTASDFATSHDTSECSNPSAAEKCEAIASPYSSVFSNVDSDFGGRVSKSVSSQQPQVHPGPTYSQPSEARHVYLIPSPHVLYQFGGVPGLWVGFEDKVKPSDDDLQRWACYVEPRLWVDLREFKTRMTKKHGGLVPGLEPQLRMSGHAEKGDDKVKLAARIWILYDRRRWKSELERFIEETEWLLGEGFGAVHVLRGAPRPCAFGGKMAVDGLDLDSRKAYRLDEGTTVHVHMEIPEAQSACGILCCISLCRGGQVVKQTFSRFGGQLFVEGKACVLTVGHTILECLISEYGLTNPFNDDDSDSDSEEGSVEANARVEDETTEQFGGAVQLQSIRWIPLNVNAFSGVGFVSWIHGHEISTPFHFVTMSCLYSWWSRQVSADIPDFAFWRSPLVVSKLQNTWQYAASGSVREVSISSLELVQSPTEGPVHIILRPCEAVEGVVLSIPATFLWNGIQFNTTKIRLTSPLAKGCSGSWVVRGSVLCGVVVASYEREPFAHMLPISTAELNIQSLFGYSLSVPTRKKFFNLPVEQIEASRAVQCSHAQQRKGICTTESVTTGSVDSGYYSNNPSLS